MADKWVDAEREMKRIEFLAGKLAQRNVTVIGVQLEDAVRCLRGKFEQLQLEAGRDIAALQEGKGDE